jgi:signal transduction histidine kinase
MAKTSTREKSSTSASVEGPARAHGDSDPWKRLKRHALPAASILLGQSCLFALFVFVMKSRNGRDHANQWLSRKLIQASEDERKHIARELHDDIGQRLSLISIQLGALQRQRDAGTSSYEPDLADSIRELDLLIADVHNLSHNLHSVKLEQLGLEASLGEVCASISQRHGLDVELRSGGVPENLDPEIALCFYRVAQEALNNIVKHSKSSRALVCLAGRADGLRMQVIDFGVGFNLARAVGLGLATMQERLLAISGTFSKASTPGYGTTITAEVPLHRRAEVGEREGPGF